MDRSSLRTTLTVLVVVGALLALTVYPAFAEIPTKGTPRDLVSDDYGKVGTISVQHVPGPAGGKLIVYYSANYPWRLQTVEVAVADTLAGIPLSKIGNPVPGKFGFRAKFSPAQSGYALQIPVADADLEDGTAVVFVVHATLVNTVTGATTGAWAVGTHLPTAQNDAMYFVMTCENPD